MSINDVHAKAARDAFKKAGQLFTWKEGGVPQGDPVYGRLSRDAQVIDESGVAHRADTIRLVKPDVAGITRGSSFVDEDETEFFYRETVSDDGITILITVSE